MLLNPDTPSSRKKLNSAESPPNGEPALIEVGFIRRPHGVRGEMMVDLKDDLYHLFNPGDEFHLEDKNLRLTLISIRKHKTGYLLMFEEINTPEEVSLYRFKKLFIPDQKKDGQLSEDDFFDDQKLGLKVITDDGIFLGLVAEIIKTGANDVYIVENSEGEVLLPAIPEVIISIDTDKEEMLVHIIPGLISN